jgi:DNA-3-methyladenine glycosylase I
MPKEKKRCQWAQNPEIFHTYHDKEWCVPSHDDQYLFEMLNLEGAQAGLSWLTILKRREGYRRAFVKFDARKLIKFTEAKKVSLMQDEGIIRNRLKIHAVVENAKAYLAVQKEFGTFDKYIWSFVDGKPLLDTKKQGGAAKSEAMSKDLKKRGFRFVGPTICYAYMQATGMINDHSKDCFKFPKKKSRS